VKFLLGTTQPEVLDVPTIKLCLTHNASLHGCAVEKTPISPLTIGNIHILGRAIAQAVSCRLPTAAARAQTRVSSCGIL
jgi:hypothetical protein